MAGSNQVMRTRDDTFRVEPARGGLKLWYLGADIGVFTSPAALEERMRELSHGKHGLADLEER